MAHATGEYYVLVSADDKLHTSYVERTVGILQRHAAITFVYSYSEMFGAKTGIMHYREFSAEALKRGNYIPGTAMTRRSAFDVVGGYDPAFRALEDWDHWLSFAERGFRGKVLREPLLFYRQHSTNRNNTGKEIADEAYEAIRRKHQAFITSSAAGFGGIRKRVAAFTKAHTPGLYKGINDVIARLTGYHLKQR
jgi:hypothetical protein